MSEENAHKVSKMKEKNNFHVSRHEMILRLILVIFLWPCLSCFPVHVTSATVITPPLMLFLVTKDTNTSQLYISYNMTHVFFCMFFQNQLIINNVLTGSLIPFLVTYDRMKLSSSSAPPSLHRDSQQHRLLCFRTVHLHLH